MNLRSTDVTKVARGEQSLPFGSDPNNFGTDLEKDILQFW